MSSYLALARKYRPQTFEDIIGQEHVSRTLRKAIEAGRIHHAYLFTGIRGIGKTTCARVLAKALNCIKGPCATPCNECVSCTEITAGRAMDVVELDAASNRGIDDIRELREGVRYTTARDRYKIVIIDEVHMLTEAAFNALLKTLEEPPPHVRFILATTDPQKIPATILSRCQRFDFRRVTAAALIRHLDKVCRKEGMEAEEEALSVVVRQTQGSVRDSLSLLDQLLASVEGKLTEAFAKDVLGVADRRWVSETLLALLDGDAKGALLVLREVYVSGYDINTFMAEVLGGLRNALVMSVAGRKPDLVDLSEGEMERLVEIVKDRDSMDIHHCLRTMLEAVEQIRRSEFPVFAAEEALVRVASAGRMVAVPSLVRKLAALEKKIAATLGRPELFRSAAPGEPARSGQKAASPGQASAAAQTPPSSEPATQADLPGDPPEPAPPPTPEPETPSPREEDPAPDAGQAEVLVSLPVSPPPPEPTEEAPPRSRPDVLPAPKGDREKSRKAPPYPSMEEADPARLWTDFLAFLRKELEGRLVDFEGRTLEECVVTRVAEGRITIAHPPGIDGALRALNIERRLTDFLGRSVVVTLEGSDEELLDDSLAFDRKQRRELRRKEVEKELVEHPDSKGLQDRFPGQLFPVVDPDVLDEVD